MHPFLTFLLGICLVPGAMSAVPTKLADSAGVDMLDGMLDDNAHQSVDPDDILADIDISDDAGPAGSEGVVVLAHMVNSMEAAKWGVESGARHHA